MRENKFREDLYYRLKVVPIRVPPLRERIDDIFPLTVFYLDKFNQKYQLSKKVSSEASEALTMYHWPGNVRELVNLVERLVVTTTDDIIQLQDLPASIMEKGRFSKLVREVTGESLKEILELVEKETLVTAFKEHRSTRNVGKILKISQSAVMRKVKKHRLQFMTAWNV
jgi:transcriptional regulator with PAS, ATPase and Fis domain